MKKHYTSFPPRRKQSNPVIRLLNFSVFLSLMLLLPTFTGYGQFSLIVENFDYPAGTVLNTITGYTVRSGAGTNVQTIAAPGLVYAGYAGSDIGNCDPLTNTGEDLSYDQATGATSGSVYLAALVNVSAALTTGDFFLSIEYNNTFNGKIFVKSTTGGFLFGSGKNTAVYETGPVRTLNTTYLVVVKYTFNPGTNDDRIDFWVNPSIGGTEPTPTLANMTDATRGDFTQIRGFAVRQGSSTAAPTVKVDGIREGTDWATTVAPSAVPALSILPQTLTGFSYVEGSGPSASQTYSLGGVNLDGSTVTVTGNTVYEVSTDNSNFFSAVNVPYSAPTLDSLIYVRLKAGLSVGTYGNENIGNIGGGVTTALNVNCNGFVIPATPNVYTWQGASGDSWAIASNWNPSRTNPSSTDILQFNDGSVKTITGVSTQTIGQLLLSNNTSVELQATGTATLSLSGGSGADLVVPVGSSFNLGGTTTGNAITISLNTGGTATIAGSMTFSNTTGLTDHRLISVDAGSIVFQNGSVFTAGTFFNGNAFGSTNLNSVVFQAGSTYIQSAGANPFGAGQPLSVVTFETGSLYKFTATSGGPSYSGRIYANFENDSPATSQSNQGSSPMTCDNYTVTNGTVNWDFSGGVVIKGNISVASGATLTFGLATKMTSLTLSGSSAQTISGAGTLTFGINSIIIVNNPAGITLARDVTASNLAFVNGIVTTGSNTLSFATPGVLSGDGPGKYVNGNLQLNILTGYSTITFPIGDAANYTPVILDFTDITTSGTLTASTTPGLHPQAATSGLNVAKCVNRYWSLKNNTSVFTSCDATFTFVPGDILGGGNPDNFIMTKWDPSTWSSTTIGTRTATTTKITGLTSFSDFMDGEVGCINTVPVSVSIAASENPVNAGVPVTVTATPTNGGSSPAYQWKVNAGEVNGATNATFEYSPANNDHVVCVMTSNVECPSENPVTSDTIVMTVITIPQNLTVTGTVDSLQTTCYNATETITVAGNGTSFIVKNYGTATMIAGQNIFYYPGTTVLSGGYMHGYIAPGGPYCGGLMPSMMVAKAGVEEVTGSVASAFFKVYPNPTSGEFTVELQDEVSSETIHVEVYGMKGDNVLKATIQGEKKSKFTLAGKQPGVYFIRVIGSNRVDGGKIVKQ